LSIIVGNPSRVTCLETSSTLQNIKSGHPNNVSLVAEPNPAS
jgi:hypothetical protein